ncbi:MAG: hypothetical protein J7598_13610 [Mitsuaria chitosanitabida]|jgi:hypothetical protein|uniref:major capsid protein n=1 Tax=Roseateles chitosanitabidus TaxID=65048 RepID=UPI001B0A78D2|nr:major capsid protein [Roseateles chitosanitabidus]MBO9687637.1 hypothetical protein [Roseateles chitosanitabidus]
MKTKLMQLKQLADKTAARAALAAGGLLSMGAARAADPDTSAITGAATTVGVVGTAVFAVYVAVKVFKWMRSAL